jgi:hypothetical protein
VRGSPRQGFEHMSSKGQILERLGETAVLLSESDQPWRGGCNPA